MPGRSNRGAVWYPKLEDPVNTPDASSTNNSLFNWNTNKNFWDKPKEDIAGSFGLPDKYTKFIENYDPYQENMANKQFSTGMSSLRKEGGQSLFDMLKTGREISAKSGFAGSGAISRDIDSTRKQLMERFGTQSEGMRSDRYGSIMGARKDYEKSIYDTMTSLAQGGVKFDEVTTTTGGSREQKRAQWRPKLKDSILDVVSNPGYTSDVNLPSTPGSYDPWNPPEATPGSAILDTTGVNVSTWFTINSDGSLTFSGGGGFDYNNLTSAQQTAVDRYYQDQGDRP